MIFLGQLVSTIQSCTSARSLPIIPRLFSTTSFVHAGYKMKSHSGAKKRWRSLASGVAFKRVSIRYGPLYLTNFQPFHFQAKAGHSHLNVSKRPGRINRLGTTAYATDTQAVKLKKCLLPYGSNWHQARSGSIKIAQNFHWYESI